MTHANPGPKCRNCGKLERTSRPQTFKSGESHLRLECANCGSFIAWQKNTFEPNDHRSLKARGDFRRRCFDLVKRLANAETDGQLFQLKSEAFSLLQLDLPRTWKT